MRSGTACIASFVYAYPDSLVPTIAPFAGVPSSFITNYRRSGFFSADCVWPGPALGGKCPAPADADGFCGHSRQFGHAGSDIDQSGRQRFDDPIRIACAGCVRTHPRGVPVLLIAGLSIWCCIGHRLMPLACATSKNQNEAFGLRALSH